MQENNINKCALRVFLVVISVFIIPFLLIVAVIIYMKNSYDFKKTLKVFGLYDCYLKFGILLEQEKNKLEKKDYYKKPIEDKNTVSSKSFRELLNSEVGVEPPVDKGGINLADEVRRRTNILKNKKKDIIQSKNISSQTSNHNKSFNTEKKYKFNGGKSVWDDYESVNNHNNK